MHLGMSGSFRVAAENEGTKAGDSFHFPRGKNATHDHVVLHLQGGTGANCTVIYNDPRRFGFMTLIDRRHIDSHRLFAGLGIEPTGNQLAPAALAEKFAGRAAPLKAVLLDQKIIAGLGNIYVCEALWRARLSPRRAAGTLVRRDGTAGERLDRLTDAVRAVIADAIAAGGSSLRDYVHADGSLGYFQHVFAVYDRAGKACQRRGCGGTIARIVQSGRSSFYCPRCQR
jgi:formamidopyrimidine-DNA glycosylase